jgi:L-ascorbate metabolism protein UlaG (beta-lactamase superfamily)
MKLIKELYAPDVLILPVGDRFTMGPEHASIAAEWISAEVTIPCHYGTWPLIEIDQNLFAPTGTRVEYMNPEDIIELESKS